MRIYFDMCSLQRPLDTKTQIRVAVEAEAILNVIALWEAGQFEKEIDTLQTNAVSPLELITELSQ
jgi:hypothetical protein